MRQFINITINGSIRFWTIERNHGNNTSIIAFFNMGGAKSEQGVVENETKYNRRIKDKIKDGYVEISTLDITIEDALRTFTEGQVKQHVREAMKCQKYDPSKFDYPCSAQPKLNGLRCYIVWAKYVEGEGVFLQEKEGVVMYSMGGLRYNVPHVADRFKKEDFMSDEQSGACDIYYDGELYVHGEKLNIIKKRIPLEKASGGFANNSLPVDPVKFYCFDIALDDVKYEDRRVIRYNAVVKMQTGVVDVGNYKNLNKFPPSHNRGNHPIVYVHDNIIKDHKDAEAYTQHCIKLGFEGSVLRSPDNLYRFGKRPKDIIKIKEYKDGEFEVLDIIPKSDDKEHVRGCKFVCRNDINDNTFKSSPEGSFDEQDEWLANKEKYLGKMVTIKYYERSGVDKVPFHSNVITVRDYE